jgi:hypothetical protein
MAFKRAKGEFCMNDQLTTVVIEHWQNLRGRTYDLLDELTDADLSKRLPFAESQDLLYQFYCMLGTQESWPPVLREGKMRDWSCSLAPAPAGQVLPIVQVRTSLQEADRQLFVTLKSLDWQRTFVDGSTPLAKYLRLVEHEAHHQGQLINLIYANHLPIPTSWADAWALTREE